MDRPRVDLEGATGDGGRQYVFCNDVFKIYKVADLEVVALRGLDLRVDSGEIIAIVGAPGSGKSTTASKLAEALNRDSPGCAAVLAMDGYHYDDRLLVPRGLRPRKGAPHNKRVFEHVDGLIKVCKHTKNYAKHIPTY